MKPAYQSEAAAGRYDAARNLPEQAMGIWLDRIQACVGDTNVETILDLGCGTGRFTIPLSAKFQANAYGVEPSVAMLEVAKRQVADVVTWMQGSADAIPLEDASVDLVFMSQVYHHIPDPDAALTEIRRVLRPNGAFVLRTATKDNNRNVVWMRCFPEAMAIDEYRMPEEANLLARVQSHGFELISNELVSTVFAVSYDEYFEKISQRGLSALLGISDDAFESGLKRLKTYIAEQPKNTPVHEKIPLLSFRR